MLDRAALIRLLRPVHDEVPTLAVPTSTVRSASSTAEFAGIALIICEIMAAVSSAASDEGSDLAEIATGATMAIAVMNWNIFFIVFDATTSS